MDFAADDGAVWVMTIWVCTVGIATATLNSALAGLFSTWLLIGTALIGIATWLVALFYPPRYAAALRGCFDGVAVRASKGVFKKQEIFIPMGALRTFEVSSTPIHRFFKCSTVVLRFAGGAARIPLLPSKQALELAKALETSELNHEKET